MEAVEHAHATPELAAHRRPIFEVSPDGIYVWLDEAHWIRNQRTYDFVRRVDRDG
jgi:hypothetical protein